MTAVRVVAAVVVALLLQSVLARLAGEAAIHVDLVLVAVTWVALRFGRVSGVLGGTLAGLAQDALGGGVLGIGGLAKSVSGYLTGIVGTQFIVTQTVPRFLVFLGATAVNALIFMGLYVLLGLRHYDRPYLDVAIQGLSNAVIGVLVFEGAELLPGARERWRIRRAYRGKRRFR
ncbi:MAG: rod shape-determining protein MreD [Acidobacteria bacterium]|nr:rod shape-determining protein MreD [Acidobacteriota bacterium]